MKIGLDINIFLSVKNKKEPFYQYSEAISNVIDEGVLKAVIPIISIAELCIGYYRKNELIDKDEFIARLYSNKNYNMIEMNLKVADKAGEIKNNSNLKLPVSIITASILLEGASCLITNEGGFENAKDFISVFTSKEFYENNLQKEG